MIIIPFPITKRRKEKVAYYIRNILPGEAIPIDLEHLTAATPEIKKSRCKYTDAEIEMICKQRSAGKSIDELAEAYGVHRSTICRYLNRFKIY